MRTNAACVTAAETTVLSFQTQDPCLQTQETLSKDPCRKIQKTLVEQSNLSRLTRESSQGGGLTLFLRRYLLPRPTAALYSSESRNLPKRFNCHG